MSKYHKSLMTATMILAVINLILGGPMAIVVLVAIALCLILMMQYDFILRHTDAKCRRTQIALWQAAVVVALGILSIIIRMFL